MITIFRTRFSSLNIKQKNLTSLDIRVFEVGAEGLLIRTTMPATSRESALRLISNQVLTPQHKTKNPDISRYQGL